LQRVTPCILPGSRHEQSQGDSATVARHRLSTDCCLDALRGSTQGVLPLCLLVERRASGGHSTVRCNPRVNTITRRMDHLFIPGLIDCAMLREPAEMVSRPAAMRACEEAAPARDWIPAYIAPTGTDHHPCAQPYDQRKSLRCKDFPVEPEAGFEPAAYALRVRCSTPELPRQETESYKCPATGVIRRGAAFSARGIHPQPCIRSTCRSRPQPELHIRISQIQTAM
jgi:hypothetical protein